MDTKCWEKCNQALKEKPESLELWKLSKCYKYNIEHYFHYCQDVKAFWENVSEWPAVNMNISKAFTVLEVLLGLIEINLNPKFFYVVNLVVLLGKQFISRCKRNKKLTLFTVYLDLVKDTLAVMEQNANVKDEKESFMEKLGF